MEYIIAEVQSLTSLRKDNSCLKAVPTCYPLISGIVDNIKKKSIIMNGTGNLTGIKNALQMAKMRSWAEWHPLKHHLNHQIYWSSELINELEDFFDTFKQTLTLQLNTDKTENISRFTDLLQTTVRSSSNAKVKLNTHKARPFPRNSWFDAECKNKKWSSS